jgi:hypothetical protein
MKQIHYLFLLAFFCMMFWFLETIIRGWEGLKWLNYLHYSMWMIPIIVHFWVIWVNGKFQFLKHIVVYPILYISYFMVLFMVIGNFAEGVVAIHPILNRFHLSINLAYPLFLSPIILFPVITFLCNLIAARMEKKRLTKINKWILFFSPFIIPAVSAIFTILLFTTLSLFPPTPPDPIENGLEVIHWAKSGSLIFSFIAYEGMYYLWLKEKW